MKRITQTGAACLLVGLAGTASGDEPNLARTSWSAFQCATYAGIAGRESENERLFKIGYDAGKRFVAGARSNTLPANARKQAPIGFLLYLSGGPSDDFILGRIFEGAMSDAYDSIVKRDSNGMPLDATKWVTDDKIKSMMADTRFTEANCELIR